MSTKSQTKIRIGTRASNLALIQADEVKNLLINQAKISVANIEIVPITTSGDKIQDRNLAEIGGKGLFVKELEESLLSKRIDIAVHSAKDVPPIINTETKIAGFTTRKDARDYFVSHKFDALEKLPKGAIIGTSSARRKAILLKMRPDLKIVNFRGNVDTRLAKLQRGEIDATILALCGLLRLKKEVQEKNIIALETMIPAAGQGTLALQILSNDKKTAQIINEISDPITTKCVEIERDFLRQLNASCKTPLSCHCVIDGDYIKLQTAIFDFDGSEFFATNHSLKIDESTKLTSLAANEIKGNKKASILLSKIIC